MLSLTDTELYYIIIYKILNLYPTVTTKMYHLLNISNAQKQTFVHSKRFVKIEEIN